jgi:hypothetical protein
MASEDVAADMSYIWEARALYEALRQTQELEVVK